MRLTALEYIEHPGKPKEWKLERMTLRDINLVIGRNAVGKTRVLSIIATLSRLVSGRAKLTIVSAEWKAEFLDEGSSYTYVLRIADSKVIEETFSKDNQVLLDRNKAGGEGMIFATDTGKMQRFQSPETDLAVVLRRDRVQHEFLFKLDSWGRSVFVYYFGTDMGKQSLVLVAPRAPEQATTELDVFDQNQVVKIYREGKKQFGDAFNEAIKEDMRLLGYPTDDIADVDPTSIIISAPAPARYIGVKESGFEFFTEQFDISQGMFRALSLIIQTNYLKMSSKSQCLIIDDLGEGMDFVRSAAMLKLMTERAKNSNIQLIIATNDRVAMNSVPLEWWTVLRREGGVCHVYNYDNSKKLFDEFRFTGLSNFDFYAMDFVQTGFGEGGTESSNEEAGDIH